MHLGRQQAGTVGSEAELGSAGPGGSCRACCRQTLVAILSGQRGENKSGQTTPVMRAPDHPKVGVNASSGERIMRGREGPIDFEDLGLRITFQMDARVDNQLARIRAEMNNALGAITKEVGGQVKQSRRFRALDIPLASNGSTRLFVGRGRSRQQVTRYIAGKRLAQAVSARKRPTGAATVCRKATGAFLRRCLWATPGFPRSCVAWGRWTQRVSTRRLFLRTCPSSCRRVRRSRSSLLFGRRFGLQGGTAQAVLWNVRALLAADAARAGLRALRR